MAVCGVKYHVLYARDYVLYMDVMPRVWRVRVRIVCHEMDATNELVQENVEAWEICPVT